MIFVLLVGCSLFIGEAELLESVDLDGDGVRGPAYGGDDCNDRDASVHPGAPDAPYDGVDSDCDGADDFDADRDGLPAATHGGLDCDDADAAVGDDARAWYVDCDGDGTAGTFSLLACTEPSELDPGLDPCLGLPGTWSLAAPPTPDCDDLDPLVSPGTSDAYYDGIDTDCDGANDFDRDGDGYVATVPGAIVDASAPGVGDCDDGDPGVHPDASDPWYDGVDGDCDGANDYDADGDGFVPAEHAARVGGTAPFAGDCDDARADIRPGALETPYDGVDSDCDGHNDYDADRDGAVPAIHAMNAGGLVVGDCDDLDPGRSPTLAEVWYDGADGDCDGDNDFDQDGDGFVRVGFDDQVGALQVGDCDDQDPSVHPGAVDAPYDGRDANCDGSSDHDTDGDGFSAASAGVPPALVDCDDTRPSVHPGADDPPYDGVDADCDGANDYDADGDGSVADPYVLLAQLPGGDCDDADPRRSARFAEVYYDGVDGDCAGGNDYDADQDGYLASAYPDQVTLGAPGGDCDDSWAVVNPAATDAPYDGVDQDCDGSNDYDADGDGFVSSSWPGTEAGDAPQGGDCDDLVPGVHPGATDPPYDGVDADCDGSNDDDADGDGVERDLDCDDFDASISPLRPEVPYDGIDQDCDGGFDYDVDGDGFVPIGFDAFARPGDGVGDCDDTEPAVHPGAIETFYDGLDQDCDGANDYDADRDAHVHVDFAVHAGGSAPLVGDCDDGDAEVNPGRFDAPYDGIDADCGGGSDADVDGDGVELLLDCTGFDCDCDDADPERWTGDWTLSAGTDLQAALDRACDGATVTLSAGTYTSAAPLTLDRPLTLVGAGPSNTVLTSVAGRALQIEGRAVVRELTLADTSEVDGGCLWVGGVAELVGVELRDCTATGDGGAGYVASGGSLSLTSGSVVDSEAARGGGFAVAPSGRLTLSDVVLERLSATQEGGAIHLDGARFVLRDAIVSDTLAGTDGGGLFAVSSRVELEDVALQQQQAARGGAISLQHSHGTLTGVHVVDAVTTQSPTSIGVAPLPAAVSLDYAGDGGVLELEDVDIEACTGFAGLSIFEPWGLVRVHDLVVRDAGAAFGVNLEPQGLLQASLIEASNLRVEGSSTAIRVAGIGYRAACRVDNVTAVGEQTGLRVELLATQVGVHNGVFASVNSAGAGVDWAHYSGSGELGGSDLAYSFVVDGSDWLVGVPAIRLPAGVSPDFCVACDDLASNPFVDATLQLGDLLGRGDPDLCLDPGAPVTCLDPGYWGGPMGPLP